MVNHNCECSKCVDLHEYVREVMEDCLKASKLYNEHVNRGSIGTNAVAAIYQRIAAGMERALK